MQKFRFFAVLMCIFCAGTVQAFPLNTDDARLIARTECRLLVKAAGDPRPLMYDVLDDVVGMSGYALKQGQETGLRVWKTTGGLPDFGFVIGERFNIATVEQRLAFNRQFSQFLVKRHRIDNPVITGKSAYKKLCAMTAAQTQLKDTELDDSAVQQNKYVFPMKPRLRAVASSALPNGLSVNYVLERQEPYNWEITDLLIGKESLVETYRTPLNAAIMQGGFERVTQWLLEQEKFN